MSRSLIKTAAVLALPALGLFSMTQRADAAIIYGLTENNNVFRFDSENPNNIESAAFVQGLGGAELLNIDFRPSTGRLYGLTTDNNLVTILPATGQITSSVPVSVPLNGTSFGFDVNPVTDRIRIISDAGQNLSVDPTTGLALIEGIITGDSNIVGAAHTNNTALATATTLYTIDSLADSLNTQDSTGAQTEVGLLLADGDIHIDTTNRVGFDIAGVDRAFAAFNEIGFALSDLYSIDLETGAIEWIDQIGGGMFVRDIAVVVPGAILIPEPASVGLLAVGTLLAARRRRRA